MRKRGKVDMIHHEVVEALRKAGWKVRSLATIGAGVPDLLCYRPGQPIRLVEVKAKGTVITRDQELFIAEGWPVTIVRSVDDALAL